MRYNAKNARCYYVTASSCGTVEFPTAYSLILPLVASCVVTRDLLRLAPDFILGLRSVYRASYVGCQPDYKHVGNRLQVANLRRLNRRSGRIENIIHLPLKVYLCFSSEFCQLLANS